MDFKEFNQKIRMQFDKMAATGQLFRADISGGDLWELYLGAFKDAKIFRDPESNEHNCNCCNSFIRRYGNIVAFDSDGHIIGLRLLCFDARYKTSKNRRLCSAHTETTYHDMAHCRITHNRMECAGVGIEQLLRRRPRIYRSHGIEHRAERNRDSVFERISLRRIMYFCMHVPHVFCKGLRLYHSRHCHRYRMYCAGISLPVEIQRAGTKKWLKLTRCNSMS